MGDHRGMRGVGFSVALALCLCFCCVGAEEEPTVAEVGESSTAASKGKPLISQRPPLGPSKPHPHKPTPCEGKPRCAEGVPQPPPPPCDNNGEGCGRTGTDS